mgnify:CR=1 FL=1
MIAELSKEHLPTILQMVENQSNEEKEWNSHITPNWLSDEVERAQSLGLFKGEALVAFIFYRRLPEAIEISFLMVDLGQRRRGLMKKLVDELLALYPKEAIWLEVHEVLERVLGPGTWN